MSMQIKFGTSGWRAVRAEEFTFANVPQLKALCNQVGSYYQQRENFRLTPEVKEKFTQKLESDPRVVGLLPAFWNEPVVQVYFEARTERDLEKLRGAAKQWIFD